MSTVTTLKPPSDLDSTQNIQRSYNDVNSTLSVDGFLTGLVGRRVDLSITTTTVAGDTENYAFSENGVGLYTLQIVYTDGTRSQLLFARRTA
jgi:hypothetical protein